MVLWQRPSRRTPAAACRPARGWPGGGLHLLQGGGMAWQNLEGGHEASDAPRLVDNFADAGGGGRRAREWIGHVSGYERAMWLLLTGPRGRTRTTPVIRAPASPESARADPRRRDSSGHHGRFASLGARSQSLHDAAKPWTDTTARVRVCMAGRPSCCPRALVHRAMEGRQRDRAARHSLRSPPPCGKGLMLASTEHPQPSR